MLGVKCGKSEAGRTQEQPGVYELEKSRSLALRILAPRSFTRRCLDHSSPTAHAPEEEGGPNAYENVCLWFGNCVHGRAWGTGVAT